MVMKRFEIIEKLYLSKALLKMAGGGMHSPHPPWIRPWYDVLSCFTAHVLQKANLDFLRVEEAKNVLILQFWSA